jgi:diguanylate cyclase (GGDEF)-like protein
MIPVTEGGQGQGVSPVAGVTPSGLPADNGHMDHPVSDTRASWICRDSLERARFMDLHARLLKVNTRVLALVVLAAVAALPALEEPLALLPTVAGIAAFGSVQRSYRRFARPELWVFAALLGAEAMIAAALTLTNAAATPAAALVAWPVAGLAGRFHNRALAIGTTYGMAITAAAILVDRPDILEEPLALSMPLIALVAVALVTAAHRDSDIAQRGAAILDPLTGMLNRGALNIRLTEIEHQSALTGEPVAVIVADLDHFKSINDEHGHAIGDAVLRDVAYVLRRELRAYDLSYRMGGEEFVVLVLGAELDAAAQLAERLRAAVAMERPGGLDVTASFGVAASTRRTRFDWSETFAEADAALYSAKSAGRDQVAVAAVTV